MPVVRTLEISFEIISVIICSLICVLLIGLHYCNNPYSHPQPNIMSITISAMVMYIMSMSISMYMHSHTLSQQSHIILNGIILIGWHCGQILCYILFLLRIRYAFSGSKYRLSLWFYILFGILLFAYIICVIAWMITRMINIDDLVDLIHDTYAIMIELIDFILSVGLIVMFMRKIKVISIDLSVNALNSIVYDDPDKLLNITVKYFILAVVVTISSQIEAILVCITWIGVISNVFKNIKWFGRAQRLLFPLDSVINAIALFLTFEMNDKFYMRCCKCCDKCIKHCCRNKKRIGRVYSFEMKEVGQSSDSQVHFSLMSDQML
eukprot:57359_1